jgi:hypothetical protein
MIFLNERGAKDGQEASAGDGVDRSSIPVHLLLGQGIQGAHLAVERIKPDARPESRGMCWGTPEQRDQFPLAVGSALDRGGGGRPGG